MTDEPQDDPTAPPGEEPSRGDASGAGHDITPDGPENVFWQETKVSREEREEARGHRGFVLWFTGLSASGKTTLAALTEERLHRRGHATFMLDGDNVRHGLNSDLGFSPEDRDENIRRVGEVAKLFVESGAIVTTSFISPYREVRQAIRENMTRDDDFVEVFVDCPLEVCEERDPKGLYAQARAGEIDNFTGIDAPYEEPRDPEIVVRTHREEPGESMERILGYLRENGYIGDPLTVVEADAAAAPGSADSASAAGAAGDGPAGG
jgi:adenylylsulfate kinase